MSNLKTRLITAFVLILVFLITIFSGGFLLKAFVMIVAAVCAYEYYNFSLKENKKLTIFFSLLSLFALFGYTLASFKGLAIGLLIALILVLSFLCFFIEKQEHQKDFLAFVPAVLLGFCYPGLFLVALYIVATTHSKEHLFFLVTIVSLLDTGGYFFGGAIGGKKLAPRISPKKTISGLIGGVFLASVTSAFLAPYLGIPLNAFKAFFLGTLIALLAVFGDLFESLLKRTYEVKDSSNFLPGHGGFLDRIDGLLFAAAALFLI